MSILWIWFIFVILTCGLSGSIYFINLISVNLDKFINSHNSVSNDIGVTLYQSIEVVFFNLMVTNLICLFIVISLIAVVYFRFHLNKNMNSIYIWILIILLIVTLAYSAYISGELYTNIDSYINIYKYIKN
jgi:hypothetical protein